MIWTSTEEEHNSKHNEAQDGQNFDGSKPELCFTEEGDSNDVQGENYEQDDGDPDSNGYSLGPVLDDDGSGGDFCGEQHGECVPEREGVSSKILCRDEMWYLPVVPAHGESETGIHKAVDKVWHGQTLQRQVGRHFGQDIHDTVDDK